MTTKHTDRTLGKRCTKLSIGHFIHAIQKSAHRATDLWKRVLTNALFACGLLISWLHTSCTGQLSVNDIVVWATTTL